MKMLLLAGSLFANALLLATLAWPQSSVPATIRHLLTPSARAPEATAPSAPASAAAAGAKRTPLWQSLEAGDLKLLRDRLLAAGFPPLVVREIILAKINDEYARRTARLTETDPSVPFWKLPAVNYYFSGDTRVDELMAIQRDRSRLVRDLLGDPMFSTEGVTAEQQRRFGNLSAAKVDALERIEADYREMTMGIQAGTRGIRLQEDQEKFALLQREKKADLAAVLTPEELAEYEMRNSPITSFIRTRLGGFDSSESEFKALYGAFQEYGEKYGTTGAMPDYQSRQESGEVLMQKLRTAFGDARYADFVRETNDEFQQLSAIARRENVTREAATQAFGVRDTTAQESMRIFNDTSLSAAQKREALQALAQDSRKRIEAALGNAAPSYMRLANSWLRPLEQGGAVEFTPLVPMVVSGPTGTTIFTPSQMPRIRMLPKP